jgi:hypothetical protein
LLEILLKLFEKTNENEIICQCDELNNWYKISGAKEALHNPGGIWISILGIRRSNQRR